MKTTILTLSTIAMLGIQANASTQEPVTCWTATHKVFTFQLESAPPGLFDKHGKEQQIQQGFASVLHGVNAFVQVFPTQITITPVLTKTLAGFEYNFNLPDGAQVALSNVYQHNVFPTQSEEPGPRIKGKVQMTNGEVFNLLCE